MKIVQSEVDMLQLVLIFHERLLPFSGNTTGLLLQLCLSYITNFNNYQASGVVIVICNVCFLKVV